LHLTVMGHPLPECPLIALLKMLTLLLSRRSRLVDICLYQRQKNKRESYHI
jgi:hypothetical protein